jgi:hypothetical protein
MNICVLTRLFETWISTSGALSVKPIESSCLYVLLW